MKTKNLIQLHGITLIVGLLLACGSHKKTKEEPLYKNSYLEIKQLSWLIGKWEMNNNPDLTTETWSILNDSVFAGTSLTMGIGKDTLFCETITIEQKGTDIFYIPVVNDQNEGKPTLFKLATIKGKTDINRVIFENPEHDFPQRIMYELKGDSLLAEISGKDHSEKFPMVKVK